MSRVFLDFSQKNQRLVKIPVDIKTKAVKLTVKAAHGVDKAKVFAFDVK